MEIGHPDDKTDMDATCSTKLVQTSIEVLESHLKAEWRGSADMKNFSCTQARDEATEATERTLGSSGFVERSGVLAVGGCGVISAA